MARILPLFPLQLVVFPGEDLNLHIFEPRYKQLIEECRDEGLRFGIPAYFEKSMQDIATEIELTRVEKIYPNGEMDVRTRALGLVRVKEFYEKMPRKLYSGAEVEDLELIQDGDFLVNEKILELLTRLFELLQVEKDLPTNIDGFCMYDIAHHIGLSIEQEFQLLSLLSESERQAFVQQHLEKLIPVLLEMERLKEKIRMNGHFKNLIPPAI
jgi:ATP-dependent Lon protease